MSKKVEVPKYTDVGLGGDFLKKIELRQEYKLMIDELTNSDKDGKLDLLNVEIGIMLIEAGEESVQTDHYKVTVAEGQNVSISKEKLLELGVPADVIMQATRTTPYTYLVVTEKRTKEK